MSGNVDIYDWAYARRTAVPGRYGQDPAAPDPTARQHGTSRLRLPAHLVGLPTVYLYRNGATA